MTDKRRWVGALGLLIATVAASVGTISLTEPKAPLAVALSTVAEKIGVAEKPQPPSRNANKPEPLPIPIDGYFSPGDKHKFLSKTPEASREILDAGGRMLDDYGSFQLFEVSTELARQLIGRPSIELRDDMNVVYLNVEQIDTTIPSGQKYRSQIEGFDGKRLHLIQFNGPIRQAWIDQLEGWGVQRIAYIPENAYLVYGDFASLSALQTESRNAAHVQWEAPFYEEFRIHPNAIRLPVEAFEIQRVRDEKSNDAGDALIKHLGGETIVSDHSMGYYNLTVRLSKAELDQVAALPDVVSIHPYIEPELLDERQNQIISGNITGNVPTGPGYLAWLGTKGFTQAQFTASGFTVDVSDQGIDNATTSPNHFGLYVNGVRPGTSRVAYHRNEGTVGSHTGRGCAGHGTIDAFIVAGYNNSSGFPHADASGFRYGLGVCPFVKVGGSVIFDPGFTNPDFENLQSRAYRDTARISTNSWGAAVGGAYNTNAQRYDFLVRDAQPAGSAVPNAGNQEMVIVFAAGNSGSGSTTIGSPATGKNVITVGASENVHPFGGSDGCAIPDSGADNLNDIIGFSSRGPCTDGRIKPDIVAPGTHVTGGVYQVANPPANGQADPCYNGSNVCGGVGSIFFPAGQQWYTASSGTSHACPAVAGAAALVRQFFINQSLAAPSPAMTKAFLMNSARYITGTGAGGNLPSNSQGMGLTDMGRAFDGTGRVLKDQVGAQMFTATGQTRTFTGTILDNTKPFRVTLAWTDAPGNTSGAAYNNNLDLEVTVGGQTYLGNVFTGANSVTGGTADIRNNVESVFLPAGVTGSFSITVKATNINSDGVPNVGGALDQDFGLVVYNGSEVALPAIGIGAVSLMSESCLPGNNNPDPGEGVVYNITLENTGNAATVNLVATMQGNANVLPITPSQNYGVIGIGSSAIRPFSFALYGNCDQNVTVTLQLQDGATDLGTVQFTLRLGDLGAPAVLNYSSGNLSVPLPDLTTTEHTINVADAHAVAKVRVRVRFNHTFNGDLVVSLVHPDGTAIVLSNRRGGSGDNFGSGANNCSGTFTVFDDDAATPISSGSAPFAGTFRPDQALSGLNGKATNGDWKIRIADVAGGDSGTLFCWQLELTYRTPICCDVALGPRVPWYTIDGGGGTFSTGGGFTIGGTAGQHDANVNPQTAPGGFALKGGFWLEPLLGDVNGDGCVDDIDLARVLSAFGMSGPLNEDVNGDGIVDDVDLAIVLSQFGVGC
ncbi:MAG: S8 family serine peptidase [Armatimonadetes bacterium]|nr:S8 family serine peptidase [Armatimonadota bacterium]